jgi:hypothetical protein
LATDIDIDERLLVEQEEYDKLQRLKDEPKTIVESVIFRKQYINDGNLNIKN